MRDDLGFFEAIARRAFRFTSGRQEASLETEHPFEARNIHPALPSKVRELFDDGHYSQATFEAFKFVDKKVQQFAKVSESGFKLMMAAFADTSPMIQLTPLISVSDRDEQRGYQFMFAGSVLGIRNPRGHENIVDGPDTCLDHLGIASHLLRRLNEAGFS